MSTANAPARSTGLRRVIWLTYWLALFVVMHVPLRGGSTPMFPGLDKVVHAVLYFLLVVLGARVVARRDGHRGAWPLPAWAVVYLLCAGLDEWLQRFVSRTPSWGDFAADAVGIVAGTGLAIALGRRGHGGVSR